MKKGCMIALVVVALLIVAIILGLGVTYARMSKQLGLSEAPAISHETVASGSTVLRVVLKPETMTDLFEKLFPANNIPPFLTKIGYTPKTLLPMFLPREVAVLAAPDMASNQLNLTFFLNEKRGGPALVDALNKGTYSNGQKPLDNFPLIKWAPEGASLPQRGEFQLKGSMAIPDTVEQEILKSWKPTPPVEPLRIEGNHHLEAVVDNRNGNILTLYATLMAARGQDWEAFLKNSQVGPMVTGVLPDILDIRASGDLKDFDNANINLRIDATAEKGPSLEFIAKMIWPNVLDAVAQNGMTLKGEPVWDAQKGALMIDLGLSGFKPMLERSLGTTLPGATTAKSARK